MDTINSTIDSYLLNFYNEMLKLKEIKDTDYFNGHDFNWNPENLTLNFLNISIGFKNDDLIIERICKKYNVEKGMFLYIGENLVKEIIIKYNPKKIIKQHKKHIKLDSLLKLIIDRIHWNLEFHKVSNY